VFLVVASSLIALVYIGRVVEIAYFRPISEAAAKASDPPLNMLLPILVLAAATIYFGLFTDLSAGIASKAAQALVGGLK
jgi:multicomponent Na+:H+ antiporter subunit D